VTRLTMTDPEETRAAGSALGALLEPGDVVILTGELGAGKTALTQGIAQGLGVAQSVTSPTFNLLLVYPGHITLNHFDLYRLERAEELQDIDYWGTLESDGVSVVEWGDRFAEAMPAQYLLVRITISDDTERVLDIGGEGARGTRLARSWIDAVRPLAGDRVNGGSDV
jgi:tRNA threonylcarbamoyladenosine biosynthesis protein TsaE